MLWNYETICSAKFLSLWYTGSHMTHNLQFDNPLCPTCITFKRNVVNSRGSHLFLLNKPLLSRGNRKWSMNSSDQLRRDYISTEPNTGEPLNGEIVQLRSTDRAEIANLQSVNNFDTSHYRPKMFGNRFLNFVRLSSLLNNAAESFFKSEIRRRLFVTAVLILISRIGYFIPLPGFDRRLIPQDYLSFVSGSVGKLHESTKQLINTNTLFTTFRVFCVFWVCYFKVKVLVELFSKVMDVNVLMLFTADELGDSAAELKMSLFQLGISPQIIASIIMQVCRFHEHLHIILHALQNNVLWLSYLSCYYF